MTPKRAAGPAVVLALAVLAGCGAAGPDTAAAPPVSEASVGPEAPAAWVRTAAAPLSARNSATAVWTGAEVLVFGGETFTCGSVRGYSMSSCAAPTAPPLRDGAAYDPRKDSWRKIARAPVPILYASTAVLGDDVYVMQGEDMIAYGVAENRWRQVAAPPEGGRLVAIGDLLVAYRSVAKGNGRDHYWDGGRWKALPPAPAGAVFEREMVDVGGAGVLVGRRADAKGNYSDSGLAAALLDPVTLRWTALRYPAGRDAADLVTYAPQPLHAVDGDVVAASRFGDRFQFLSSTDNPLLGGILDLEEGWSRLPQRPLTDAELAVRAERERLAKERSKVVRPMPASAEDPPLEHFSWLNVGGDGFVVAGRWALDVEARTWQFVPAGAGPVGLGDAAAVWAGDRVFVWGGAVRPRINSAVGWTWRPSRPLL